MSDEEENYVYSEDEEWEENSEDESGDEAQRHPTKQSRTTGDEFDDVSGGRSDGKNASNNTRLGGGRAQREENKPKGARPRADSGGGNNLAATRARLGDSEYALIERSDVARAMAAKAKEVSELLNVTTSCAEALLRGSGWSSERLMESFMSDSETLAKKCGVDAWTGGADVLTAADESDEDEVDDGLVLGGPRCATLSNLVAPLDSKVPLAAFKPVPPPKPSSSSKTAKSSQKSSSKSSSETNALTVTCRICCTDVPSSELVGAPCGHLFCSECYEGYLSTKADEGATCVETPCPEDKCHTLVPPALWNKVLGGNGAFAGIDHPGGKIVDAANDADSKKNKASSSSSTTTTAKKKKVCVPVSSALAKYRKYRVDNFITFSKELRWCPAPGCDKVVRAGPCVTSVKCAPNGCGYSFCMKCGDEAHQPASCDLLRQWQEKCQNESETANWILANTKRCPKCQTRIEKNQGCNHMSCSQCKHEFCWMCMGDWAEHGASTGGYYKCNKFDPLKTGDEEDDTARAKRELDRYLHFYKRYHGHDQAQKFASKQLEATEKRMVELQESTHGSWIDVQFLKTANEMVIDCRRALKSTYVFGYYLPHDAHKQRELFENLQEHLERFTETLSELTELPLDKMDRTEVVNITRVTESFLHNLIVGAENGLELEQQHTSSSASSSSSGENNNKSGKSNSTTTSKASSARNNNRTGGTTSARTTATSSSSSSTTTTRSSSRRAPASSSS